jgi:HSP20 family protein
MEDDKIKKGNMDNKEYDWHKDFKSTSKDDININFDFGLGKLFGGLKNIIDTVSDLSGGEIKREGTIREIGGKVKGVYGFTVRTMDGNTSIEEFGNKVKKDETDGELFIDTVREPIIDVIEEGDIFTVIAEIPGVSENDITVVINGDIVQITAKSSTREYEKELLFKYKIAQEPVKKSYVNGMLEIKLKKLDV